MSYAVSILEEGEIQLDTLPVAKITHYPLEKRDHKPYAQGALGLDQRGLSVRLISFEVEPEEDSKIQLVLAPFPQRAKDVLVVEATPQQASCWILSDSKEIPLSFRKAVPQQGGDLQGEFWGYDLLISRSVLEQHHPLVTLEDKELSGNLYKLKETPPTHFGSFGGVDFSQGVPYSKDQMTTFQLVGY